MRRALQADDTGFLEGALGFLGLGPRGELIPNDFSFVTVTGRGQMPPESPVAKSGGRWTPDPGQVC